MNRFGVILTAALAAQAVLFYTASQGETVAAARPLTEFTTRLGEWNLIQEGVVEQEVRDVLRADDVMTRIYARPELELPASVFVGYFKTQRTGQAPHSPKNCLPGSGWEPSETGTVRVPVPGRAEPIEINRYVVSRGADKSVVLYWYQSRDRVIANEYAAKYWLVADSIRYHRSDTALVRVVVPVSRGDEGKATAAGVEFVRVLYPELRSYLPG